MTHDDAIRLISVLEGVRFSLVLLSSFVPPALFAILLTLGKRPRA